MFVDTNTTNLEGMRFRKLKKGFLGALVVGSPDDTENLWGGLGFVALVEQSYSLLYHSNVIRSPGNPGIWTPVNRHFNQRKSRRRTLSSLFNPARSELMIL